MINYYLQKAERIGEILLPAASHMLLSLQFLKEKKVCVTKHDYNVKIWFIRREKQTTEPQYKYNILGQPGATANSKRSCQLYGKTNEPGGHVLQRAVCRLQRRWWQVEEADCWHLSNNANRVGCRLRPQWDIFFNAGVTADPRLYINREDTVYNCV